MSSKNTITIDGVEYVRADSVTNYEPPEGTRHVIVIDRGWIFAGDVTEENGRIILKRPVNVVRWSGVGFDGMLANPKSDKVALKPIANPVNLPAGSEVYRVPVADDWGL